jgi:long-chain fatty acid transport protein
MYRVNCNGVLRAASLTACLLAGAAEALAGSFAIHEQSVYGQGAAYAGIAAGGVTSAMFWNPATMTQFAGMSMEQSVVIYVPDVSHTPSTSTLAGLLPALHGSGVNNSGTAAVVPQGYSTWQLSERFWVGMGSNAPFGLASRFPQNWAGAAYGQDSSLQTFNFNPNAAFKLNDWISVGLGLQAQYGRAEYESLAVPFPASNLVISGAGWGFGWTAGITLTPNARTQIGIGYRSALDQKIKGNLVNGPAPTTNGAIETTLKLPGILSVGLRQRMGERFTLLAGIEWTNWSRIGTAGLLQPNGAAALGPTGAPITFPFEYRDGWYYALGGEYVIDQTWMVRAGIGYEVSPITTQTRTPGLPDTDRFWYSAGASYKHPTIPGLSFDLAFTYIYTPNVPLDISAASGNPWFNAGGTYTGTVDTHIRIISLALRLQLAPPPKPVKSKG